MPSATRSSAGSPTAPRAGAPPLAPPSRHRRAEPRLGAAGWGGGGRGCSPGCCRAPSPTPRCSSRRSSSASRSTPSRKCARPPLPTRPLPAPSCLAVRLRRPCARALARRQKLMYYMPAICCYSMILTVYAPRPLAASAPPPPIASPAAFVLGGWQVLRAVHSADDGAERPARRARHRNHVAHVPNPSLLPKPPLRPVLAVSAEPLLRAGRVAGRWRCS